jgi:hypothetical protein
MAVSPQDVARLRADEAMLRAQYHRLREQVRAGELVALEPFNAHLFQEARRLRDAILAAPARYAAELAAEFDVPEWDMLVVLNSAARRLLTLAAGSGPFPGLPEAPEPAPPVAAPVKRRKRAAAQSTAPAPRKRPKPKAPRKRRRKSPRMAAE